MTSALALVRRLVGRWLAKRENRVWRKTLSGVRAVHQPIQERAVLFCDLMGGRPTAKVEALIAGLLRLKGYRSVVLLPSANYGIEEIFRAAAPNVKFMYFNSAVDERRMAEVTLRAKSLLNRTPNLQEFVKMELDGFRIGRNVQSLVLRQFRVGRLDDKNSAHRDATLRILAQSLAAKDLIATMLQDNKYDLAIFNERGYSPAAEIFDGCLIAGVDAIQWGGAPQSDCLIYKRYDLSTRGDHALSLSDFMWRQLQDMSWTQDSDQAVVDRIEANYASGAWYNRQQLQEGKAILSPDGVRRSLGLDPAKKTAVIFSHILYDATFFYGESLYDDYEQWLVETVRAAIANPKLNWVVKVHPVNVWRSRMDNAEMVQLEAETLRRNFGTLPDHVKMMAADTPINTFSLFNVIDYGLTVRGTIGMELPCFGVPVVSAGTGRYSGRGFTIDPKSRDEYVDLLATLQEVPRLDRETIRQARLHYYGALNLRPVPMKSFFLDFEALNNAASPNNFDVTLRRRADEQLLETDDLGRLVRWLSDSRTPELLATGII